MRIVALSDQHGSLPEVPPCDLLIVAGDVCPDRVEGVRADHDPARQKRWFDEHARPWLAQAPAARRILTWGNHDWCGQVGDFERDAHACATTLRIAVDARTDVPVSAGTQSISVWTTPWSNQFMNWAFMKSRDELAGVYAAIPDGIDVLVTHQPPLGYGDRYDPTGSGEVERLGNPDLLAAIDRIGPRLVICGHIHGGHGRYEYRGTTIYNVAIVDDTYRPRHAATVIDVPSW
jgi:3',5'-cyclic AMP phosphodiesterase CpdA